MAFDNSNRTDAYPRNYLETEARIIAESDTHAVVAVRVEKKWLSRNMSFLAALAELTARVKQELRI